MKITLEQAKAAINSRPHYKYFNFFASDLDIYNQEPVHNQDPAPSQEQMIDLAVQVTRYNEYSLRMSLNNTCLFESFDARDIRPDHKIGQIFGILVGCPDPRTKILDMNRICILEFKYDKWEIYFGPYVQYLKVALLRDPENHIYGDLYE